MASRSSIFTWKRREKPVFSSRGKVKEWVKQVQQACDDAAKEIFGNNTSEALGRRHLYVDDDAILEGQDLIDSWIRKKNVDDLLAECDMRDEVPTTSFSANCIHQSSKSKYFDSSPHYCEDEAVELQKPVFEWNDDFDEESAVHEVVCKMLERDVVDIKSVNDESMMQQKTKTFKDPTPKMKMRHEQVKKRANQRKIAWEKAHSQKMNEKIVESEARKQLQREEQQRLYDKTREEDEIRKEMVKIRRVMQDENTQRTIRRSREAESDEKTKKLAREEVRKELEEKEERLRREFEAKKSMKKKMLKQQEEEEVKKREHLESIKLLQSCFSSWYALVVAKQIKCGKARALLEWKQKLRIWNAWRAYVFRSRGDRETKVLNELMKERHRKEVLADRFHRQMLFHRCLAAWLCWVEKAKEERMLKEQHDRRAEKMATLLKAAASGQLWQEKDLEKERKPECDDLEEMDEVSLEPFKLPDLPNRRENCRFSKTRSKKEAPREAWPHQKLKKMKSNEPLKKQNALLNNLGSTSTRTESSRITRNSRDSLSSQNLVKQETPVLQTEQTFSTKSGNEDLRPLNRKSNAVQDNSHEIVEQKNVDTNRHIAQEPNIPGLSNNNSTCVNLSNQGNTVESVQSSRSMLSSRNKSTVTSKKATTKPIRLAMEERAKARAERKSILDAKRRAAEEDKLAKLKQEQEEREREILAEKKAALLKRKEEMKLAKQREVEKQQRLDAVREMSRKATEHYNKSLLRNFGFRPWKKLILTRKETLNNAEMFHKQHLLSSSFREWLACTRLECKRRNQLAENMHKSLLLRRGWRSWRKYRNHFSEIDKIALKFSQRCLLKKYMNIWQDFVIEERLLYWDKENKADEHSDRRLQRKAMTYWRKYIPLLEDEKQREKRRNDLRKHVVSLLPDFQTLNVNHSP